MRERLRLIALLVFLPAGPTGAQIASDGTVQGCGPRRRRRSTARGHRYRGEPDRSRHAHQPASPTDGTAS